MRTSEVSPTSTAEDAAILLLRGFCQLSCHENRLTSVVKKAKRFITWDFDLGGYAFNVPLEAESSPEAIITYSIIKNKDVVFVPELIAFGNKLITQEKKIKLYLDVLELLSVVLIEKLPPGACGLRTELYLLLYGVETYALHQWRESTDLETSKKHLETVVRECRFIGDDKFKQFESVWLGRKECCLLRRKSWIEPFLVQLLGCMAEEKANSKKSSDKGKDTSAKAEKETTSFDWIDMIGCIRKEHPKHVFNNNGNSIEATFLCGWLSLLQLQSAFMLLKEYSTSANMDRENWGKCVASICSTIFIGMGEASKMKQTRLEKLQSHQKLQPSPSTRPSKRARVASSEFELPQFLLEELHLRACCALFEDDPCLRDFIARCVAQRAISDVNFLRCMDVKMDLNVETLIAFLRPFVEEGAINLLDQIEVDRDIFHYIIVHYCEAESEEEILWHLILHIATFHDHQFLEGRREKRPLSDRFKRCDKWQSPMSRIGASRNVVDAQVRFLLSIPNDQVLPYYLSNLCPKNHPSLALPRDVLRNHIIGIPPCTGDFFVAAATGSPDIETLTPGFLWSIDEEEDYSSSEEDESSSDSSSD